MVYIGILQEWKTLRQLISEGRVSRKVRVSEGRVSGYRVSRRVRVSGGAGSVWGRMYGI